MPTSSGSEAKAKRDREVGEAIEYAAIILPGRYTIDIEIGSGSAVVSLCGPDGECDFPTNHEGLADELQSAADHAFELDAKEYAAEMLEDSSSS